MSDPDRDPYFDYDPPEDDNYDDGGIEKDRAAIEEAGQPTKYKYSIERNAIQGDWVTGYYYWLVQPIDGSGLKSGWSYTVKGARKRIDKAIAQWERTDPPAIYVVDAGIVEADV